LVDDPERENEMTQPQINTLEYIRRALSDQQNAAVVTQNNDDTLTIALDIGPGPHLVDLEALEGPGGPAGPPQFPLRLMPDVYTDPLDLPNDLLTDSPADVGKYWVISQSDENGVISSGAYIWFGTEYRFLPFGVQGPPGKYGIIRPYVELLAPNHASRMSWTGSGTDADPYLHTLHLSIPEGPAGESAALFNMPDVRHNKPPVTGQLLAATGDTVNVDGETLPVWSATSTGDIIPQPFLVPASAFSSYSGVDFSMPVSIVTFPIPPMPFPWKPLVWGQIEMQGTKWFERLPDKIGVIVLLGDSDPEVGTLVARGYGNAPRGVVTVMPHCSYPQHPAGPGEPGAVGSDSIAMTPWNDVGAVDADHTGQDGTVFVVLVNEGKQFGNNSRFDFNAAGSSLFILVCPMTEESALSPPLYAGFSIRVKLTALVSAKSPAPVYGAQAAQITLPNPGSRTYPVLRAIRQAKQPPRQHRRAVTAGLERGVSPSVVVPNPANPAWPVLRPVRRAKKL
jgi:hypothetical protein